MALRSTNKKRCRPGENPRPRPKDRQLIQDRIKELRELVPNCEKVGVKSEEYGEKTECVKASSAETRRLLGFRHLFLSYSGAINRLTNLIPIISRVYIWTY